MNDKHIVCFLDILGYQQLVVNHNKNIQMIKNIEHVFKEALDRIDKFQYRKNENEYSLAIKTVLKHTKFRVISDAILITMSLSNLPLLHKKFNNNENILVYIETFLFIISLFYLDVVSKLSYFFRGGISVGQYYENVLNNAQNIFIFSQAMVDAFNLGKKADSPRVLIGDSVYEYISNVYNGSLPNKLFDTCVYECLDGLRCLDIYHPLRNDNITKKILKNIVKGVNGQVKLNRTDPKVIRKYCCFVKYHNQKLSGGLNFPELMINHFN